MCIEPYTNLVALHKNMSPIAQMFILTLVKRFYGLYDFQYFVNQISTFSHLQLYIPGNFQSV